MTRRDAKFNVDLVQSDLANLNLIEAAYCPAVQAVHAT